MRVNAESLGKMFPEDSHEHPLESVALTLGGKWSNLKKDRATLSRLRNKARLVVYWLKDSDCYIEGVREGLIVCLSNGKIVKLGRKELRLDDRTLRRLVEAYAKEGKSVEQ